MGSEMIERMYWRVRHWLILRLIGTRSVVANVGISGRLTIRGDGRGLFANVTLDGSPDADAIRVGGGLEVGPNE